MTDSGRGRNGQHIWTCCHNPELDAGICRLWNIRSCRSASEKLAEHFDVPSQTVHRDVNMLSDANLVHRRHGEVEYVGEPGMNLSCESRQVTNIATKHAISLHVAQLIPDGASNRPVIPPIFT